MTLEKQIKITEKLVKEGIKRFCILYKEENKNKTNDIEITFNSMNIVYKYKICELGIDFMRFKPKSLHNEYNNLIYEIRFIIQFRESDLHLGTIEDKFLRMYQIFKLIYQGEIPKLDTKDLGIIYLG